MEKAETMLSMNHVSHVTSFIGQGGLRFMLTYSPADPNSAYGQLLVDVDDYDAIAKLIPATQAQLSDDFPEAEIKVWKFMLGRGGARNSRPPSRTRSAGTAWPL